METSTPTEKAKREIQQATEAARDRVRSESDRLVADAREKVQSAATEGQESATSYVSDLADALDRATDLLEERGRSGSARYARVAVRELHGLGNRVQSQDVTSWVDEVEHVARQRPLLFFGGVFLLGYTAIRLLSPDRRPDDGSQVDIDYDAYEDDDWADTDNDQR